MTNESGHTDELLSIRNMCVYSEGQAGRRTFVSGMDLDVAQGETVGIVGESGSGKSLTARSIIGLPPQGIRVEGVLRYKGQTLQDMPERTRARFRGGEIGLVLQDPFTALSPLRQCGKHIGEVLVDANGKRLSGSVLRREVARRLAEVGIDDERVADRFPFELSGGMRQRVAIAAALAQNPALLIADEPTTALDTVVQADILQLLRDIQRQRSMSLILITHDLRIAFSLCDRVNVLYAGQLLETGPAAAMADEPAHPYTLGLLTADPPIDRTLASLVGIEGSVPAADAVLESCAFADRCSFVEAACRERRPELVRLGELRRTACVRQPEISAALRSGRGVVELPMAEREPVQDVSRPIVTVSNLHVSYPVGHKRISTALDGVDITVSAGESVGLVGSSGSGKTTLARSLVGLVDPTGGHIDICGIDASNYNALTGAETRQLRGAVQYVFQDPYSSLNPVRTIGATLAEALSMRAGRDASTDLQVGSLLETVGLPPRYSKLKPATLSGGERQRVAIARALAVQPKLIVCDEPVSALDVSVQAHILTLLREVREQTGVAYLFITHDLAVVRQIVDRVYVLYQGKIVEQGAVGTILDSPTHEYTRRLRGAVPSMPTRANHLTDTQATSDV